MRIGTTGASVFAITKPRPGSAGCKLPSSVRAPRENTSVASPARKIRINALRALRSLRFLIDWNAVHFGSNQPQNQWSSNVLRGEEKNSRDPTHSRPAADHKKL
jgi:hypothetical protein